MICNNCFEEIPDGSTTCPKCYAQLTNNPREIKKRGHFPFGRPKRKMKKSAGPLFDEEGNPIRYEDIPSESSGFVDHNLNNNENDGRAYAGGTRSGGRRNRKQNSQLTPKIVIILAVSLIVIIVIIIFTALYMKQHGKKDNQNGTSGNSTATSATGNTAESSESSTEKNASASTSSTVKEVNPDNNQTGQQGGTANTADQQSAEKSSFDKDTADSYFWPKSDSRLYTYEDLKNLKLNQVILIKAEIYAREGCIFKNQEYNNYFNKKNWYKGTIKEDNFDPGKLLNYYELENVRMIDTYIEDKQ